MTLSERIEALAALGLYLQAFGPEVEMACSRAEYENKWFTMTECRYALDHIAHHYLDWKALDAWAKQYPDLIDQPKTIKKIGLVLAGNIPAVGFHDIICCFLVGHKALIKLSEKDKVLIKFFIDFLINYDQSCKKYFELVERVQNFDAVIATGSDNASNYFQHYFGKVPNIIRNNRNSAAILDGTESDADLEALCLDIFRYYGLGCRSISKLYVPTDYTFDRLLALMDEKFDQLQHFKYKNNFDYNRSVLLLSQIPHLANYNIVLLENSSLLSRIATLHYEYYSDEQDLETKIKAVEDQLQCVVSKKPMDKFSSLAFGESQSPALNSYADATDTVDFLINLN